MTEKPADPLPDAAVAVLLSELGIPGDYGRYPPRPLYVEAAELVEVGPNLIGRLQRLTPQAGARWAEMQENAATEDIELLLVSGFRSIIYQADLIRNKLAAGQAIEDILRVNAAPGFSQHHTGAAIDIATPGFRPLTEEFELSDAFAWLRSNTGRYGFAMTYPRGNAAGFVYEPWHWSL